MEFSGGQHLATGQGSPAAPGPIGSERLQILGNHADARPVTIAAELIDPGPRLYHRPGLSAHHGSAAFKDPLTGLGAKGEFQRLVNQRHMERERFGVVMIRISSLDHINNTHGLTAGDDVLEDIGDALKELESSAVRAYRVGGSTFATLVEGQRLNDDHWADAVVDATVNIGTRTEAPTRFHAGAAQGYGDTVVQVAERQLADSRKADTLASIEELGRDLTTKSTDWDVVPVVGSTAKWRWSRPHCQNPKEDVWALLEDVGRRLAGGDSTARFSIPGSDIALADRSIAQRLFPFLERNRISPRHLALELNASMFDPLITGNQLARATQFAREATAIGATVVISEYDGEPSIWSSLPTAHVGYIKPSRDLLLKAVAGEALSQPLDLLARASSSVNIELIAPYPVRGSNVDDAATPLLSKMELLALGFSYLEQPAD